MCEPEARNTLTGLNWELVEWARLRPFLGYKKNGQAAEAYLPKSSLHCGVYVTRTRDPLRDRQVF